MHDTVLTLSFLEFRVSSVSSPRTPSSYRPTNCQFKAITRSSATAKSTARPSCLIGVLYDISPEKIC